MTYSKLVIIKSLIWKLLEKCSVQGVAFIVTVVLARLLSPEEYGIVAIVTIFLSFSNILIEAGFSTALIQKKGFNNIDFSTIFYFSLFVAIIIYIFRNNSNFFSGAAVNSNYKSLRSQCILLCCKFYTESICVKEYVVQKNVL